MNKPEKIVNKMLKNDPFSEWLGVELLEVREGFVKLSIQVRDEMLNGHGVMHGGISYSLADSALAFASNTHGKKAMSIETSINHTKAVIKGDVLVAVAEEESLSNSIGYYIVRVCRENELVGLFKGVVFRKNETWEV